MNLQQVVRFRKEDGTIFAVFNIQKVIHGKVTIWKLWQGPVNLVSHAIWKSVDVPWGAYDFLFQETQFENEARMFKTSSTGCPVLKWNWIFSNIYFIYMIGFFQTWNTLRWRTTKKGDNIHYRF